MEDRKATGISLFDNGRPVVRYRCADGPYKPYVDQLCSPAGAQILRDHVPDHAHHHGLMFALSVDGVNFWEEAAAAGTEEPGFLMVDNRGGHKRPGFEQGVYWVGPDKKRLLDERRHVTSFGDPVNGATLVTWRSRLQTPPGKTSAVLSGSHYFGLGMRFVESMDKGGRFFNADGKAGEVVRGDETLTRTKWCAYTAKADGKPVTVAIFDGPKNFRPATVFTMSKPFAYLSATLNVWKEPITLKAGHPLDLCYGIALWDGEVAKATVEKLYLQWVQLSGQKN
ncbi:MAG: PmoA family protein [Planctomycetaceae bacterium]|nr:PmoA family protein [Planctomycetaceae bacterium]